jgi:hypothetical protein
VNPIWFGSEPTPDEALAGVNRYSEITRFLVITVRITANADPTRHQVPPVDTHIHYGRLKPKVAISSEEKRFALTVCSFEHHMETVRTSPEQYFPYVINVYRNRAPLPSHLVLLSMLSFGRYCLPCRQTGPFSNSAGIISYPIILSNFGIKKLSTGWMLHEWVVLILYEYRSECRCSLR